jgi:2-dehydro-3-deoxyphosphogluconate aldolase/(4S)-4-hydroxy-2-oxoglutarate aldolase
VHETLFDQLRQLRLIPIVTMDDARHAAPLADALAAGGLPGAEVTFRTDAAIDVIKVMSRRDGFLVGAGTVLTVDKAKSALDAGARFIVTPGIHPQVVEYCLANDVPISPGVATATDIAWAFDRGLRVVKFFPAETLGGAKALKALGAPYRMMRFIPTGGMSPQNVREYLRMPEVIACGGSWLAAAKLYASGDYGAVERSAREAVQLTRET